MMKFLAVCGLVILFNQLCLAQNYLNYAGSFNGANSYVAFADKPEFNPTSAITIEAWIYPTSFVNFPTMVGKAWMQNYWFGFNGSSYLRFYPIGGTHFDGSYSIPLNQWTHVAATYDGTLTKLYVNGVCTDSSFAITGPMVPNTDSLFIGCDRDSPTDLNYFFYGMMNTVRIWNVARSAQQIKESMYVPIYALKSSGNYKGLSASFLFNGGNIPTVYNLAGSFTSMGTLHNFSVVDLTGNPLSELDYNNWLSLDGNSYCSSANQDDYNATTAITVEAWIRIGTEIAPTDVTTRPIVSKSSSAFMWDYALFMAGRALFFSINSSASTQVVVDNAITDQYWHHIACTYNSVDGNMFMYIDGELAGQSNLAAKPLIDNHADSLFIGAMTAPLLIPNKFIGDIDEVRIWKDVSRTQDQIKSEMLSTRSMTSGLSKSCTIGFNAYINYVTLNNSGGLPVLQFEGNASIGSSHLHTGYTSPVLFNYYFNKNYQNNFFFKTKKKPLTASGSTVDTLNVTKNGFVIGTKVFVLLNHGYIGALTLTLTAPNGSSVDLLPPKNLLLQEHDIMVLFDPEADSSIDFTKPGLAPFSPSVKPFGDFTSFNNSPATGSWKLKISDASSEEFIRVLNGWGVMVTTNPTSVEANGKPSVFTLEQNYPNPFNPNTTIKYSIAKTSRVQIKIFDLLGREVKSIVDEEKPTGNYEVIFDAAQISSGIYFYKIQAGQFSDVKKMVVIK